MNVQSLSVVVPGGCPNKCKFCVADMHDEEYFNQIEKNLRFRDLYEKDFIARLSFARDNGCNTVILTGDGEPVLNTSFLIFFASCNAQLSSPFKWIEIQTSGVTIDDEKLRWLRNHIRVSTISLSLSDIFSDEKNAEIMGTPQKLQYKIDYLCSEIKRYEFSLRISMNMTKYYDDKSAEEIFNRLSELQANQVTFRRLYSEGNSSQALWVQENKCSEELLYKIFNKISNQGNALEILPFGAMRYSYKGISSVIDMNCMPEEAKKEIRYLILRPNCKLYTRWDDSGSILF